MIGSSDTAKTVTQQLGMSILEFWHGDNPKNILEWALTFVPQNEALGLEILSFL